MEQERNGRGTVTGTVPADVRRGVDVRRELPLTHAARRFVERECALSAPARGEVGIRGIFRVDMTALVFYTGGHGDGHARTRDDGS